MFTQENQIQQGTVKHYQLRFYYLYCTFAVHLDTCRKKKNKSRKRKTQSIELFVTKKPRNFDKPEQLVCEEKVIDSDVDEELTATEVNQSQNA
jgi:hypothetical protein